MNIMVSHYKKLCFILLILVIGLISCSSCAKKNEVTGPSCTGSSCPLPPHSADPTSSGKLFHGETWEIIIPNGWEEESTPDNDTKVYAFNNAKHSIIMLVQESFIGSYADYMTWAIKSITQLEATLISVEQVEINGTTFALIESQKGQAKLFMWLTVKNGFGYSLTCGGLVSDESNRDICFTTASSMKLK